MKRTEPRRAVMQRPNRSINRGAFRWRKRTKKCRWHLCVSMQKCSDTLGWWVNQSHCKSIIGCAVIEFDSLVPATRAMPRDSCFFRKRKYCIVTHGLCSMLISSSLIFSSLHFTFSVPHFHVVCLVIQHSISKFVGALLQIHKFPEANSSRRLNNYAIWKKGSREKKRRNGFQECTVPEIWFMFFRSMVMMGGRFSFHWQCARVCGSPLVIALYSLSLGMSESSAFCICQRDWGIFFEGTHARSHKPKK